MRIIDLEQMARDIWHAAKLQAQERKSGLALNSDKMTRQIERSLTAAAEATVAEILGGKQLEVMKAIKADITGLKKKVDTLNMELRELKNVSTTQETRPCRDE
jgi:hypothetical protein